MPFLDNKKVGNRLKTMREKTKLRPTPYAMQAGIDPSQYAKIEKGELPITENVLNKLIKEYKLEGDVVLYGTNIPENGLLGSLAAQKSKIGRSAMKSYVAGEGMKDLAEWQAGVNGTLEVLLNELKNLMVKVHGKTISRVSLELEKDLAAMIAKELDEIRKQQ